VDGSFVEANAAKESRIPREQLAEAAQVNYAVKQYLAELAAEIERRARIKTWLQDEFARTLAVNNVQSRRSHGFFISSQHPPVLLDVARCFALADGQLRWEIRYPLTRNEGLRCITVRLHPDNKLPMDYVFIPCLPRAIQRWRFSEERIQRLASIHKSLDEAVSLFLQDSSRYAKQNTPTA
jgi:hypothetical protein